MKSTNFSLLGEFLLNFRLETPIQKRVVGVAPLDDLLT